MNVDSDHRKAPQRATVEIVDPDPAIGEALTALLTTYDIDVKIFSDAKTFLDARSSVHFTSHCIMIETLLPDMSALSLLREIRSREAQIPVIILTSGIGHEMRRQAIQFGATEVIAKSLVDDFLTARSSELFPMDRRPSQTLPVTEIGTSGARIIYHVVRPDDTAIDQEFVSGRSENEGRGRFVSTLRGLTPDLLRDFTHPDFPRSCALVASLLHEQQETEIGGARYLPTAVEGVAEFAIAVAEDWQRRGIGRDLMHGIIVAAAVAGIRRLEAMVLADNFAMLKLAESLGFSITHDDREHGVNRVSKNIGGNTD